jgi:DNA helicase HerA-like ATPase
MMWLLAELYHNLPEVGDLAKPKLVFFFDEAHLLFDDAPKAFLEQIEQVVRLIRSKGVGVYFVTQTPKDVPEGVLAQLSNRIQHALRAHTPDDEKALRATVRTFPKTDFYDLAETLTSLGVGEAVVTVLNARGVPTPVVAVRMIPPASRMAPLTLEELQADIRESALLAEYGKPIDRESARELLAARLARATVEPDEGQQDSRTMTEMAGDVVQSPLGKTVVREVVRGLFGLLGVKAPRRATNRRRRW